MRRVQCGEGVALIEARVGAPSSFELLARDAYGNPTEQGAHGWRVWLEEAAETAARAPAEPAAEATRARVRADGGGAYTVTYCAPRAGRR